MATLGLAFPSTNGLLGLLWIGDPLIPLGANLEGLLGGEGDTQ